MSIQLTQRQKPSIKFIILMAMMTSIMALAIDTILPAVTNIGKDLNVIDPANLHFIITTLFVGFGIGQFIFGPLSDSFGRKKPIYVGCAFFILGCSISFIAQSMEVMIIGRFLQGFGAAAFRNISIAIIRDQYSGTAMAQTISLIMTVFILVPVFAPAIGQAILLFSPWRSIFILFIILALIVLIWFSIGQEETLKIEQRKPFSFKNIFKAALETITHPTSLIATIASGIVFGGFIGYLSSSQQIFQGLYKVGNHFPLYFGGLAISIAISSFVNSKLVEKVGIIKLIKFSLSMMSISSVLFLTYVFSQDIAIPHIGILILYFLTFFGCVGLLFGNLNTLALAPLGHIAGVASSVVGSLQNFISVLIGIFIAKNFTDSILPISIGFTSVSLICLIIILLGFKNNDIKI